MSGFGFDTLTGGGLTALDAIRQYEHNDIAFGVVDGVQIAYQMDTASGAVADGDLIVAPVGAGDARWVKLVPGGAVTHVEANRATAQSVPNGVKTTILYDTEVQDVLSEYDTSTGVFTAKYAGSYTLCAGVLLTSAAWSSGEYIMLCISINSTVSTINGPRSIAWSSDTVYLSNSITRKVILDAGDSVEIQVLQNQGAAVDIYANAGYNWLTIDRLV